MAKTYVVIGIGAFRDHAPGTKFTANLTDEVESALATGVIAEASPQEGESEQEAVAKASGPNKEKE